jgi:hypothetical protein
MKTKTRAAHPQPPTHTQFQKGKSGNPRGRPKGSRNLSGLLKEALDARVEKDGKAMTKLEAALKQIADNAAAGDPRILQMLLAELRRLEPSPAPQPPHDGMDVARVEMRNAREEFLAKLARYRAEHDRSLAEGICPTCGAAVQPSGAENPLLSKPANPPMA